MPSPTVAEQLVAGSRDLIASEGTGDLSVRRLTEASGRSTMCVYSHFGNRKRLLAEVYRSCAADLTGALAAAGPGFARAYAAYAETAPRHFLFLFAADLDGLGVDPGLRLDLADAVTDLAAASLDGADRDAALAFWLPLHGAVWLDTVQRLAGEPGRFPTAALIGR
ncbi:TetR/AcrR family transcriptional regulator [Glycomyces artemisiae]|uniref:TetR family transcriptional regulator n=1 Tax=Glycomyces artemisiae TaxID=1076443 RepID=A0A2T0UM88_9ACTN|nr:TetR/AcrR family transcriptional regulator [Glycomyces artemisiae]PRY59030.1 TetR family transcriptional regulator [Glycomyces artemisiae]